MNEYTDILSQARLFRSMEPEEIGAVLGCLSARKENYQKGERIFNAGDITDSLGLILTGSVNLVKEDYWGNRLIFSSMEQGQLFGESYACLPREPLEVSIVSAADCEVLFLDLEHALSACSCACGFHRRLIRNLMTILAKHNLNLTRKVQHMGQKTTREKLLAYLWSISQKEQSQEFDIPYNRQELADYLAVDRSAMSAELSRMKTEGLLEFHKNHFRLTEHSMEDF